MTTIQWEPVLRDVISEVLETMFFSVVDFETKASKIPPFDYESEICLQGEERQMKISLYLCRPFAKMITANLLGVDEGQVSEDDILDCLKEFTNMVGGGYHARLEDLKWQLGIPSAARNGANGEAEPSGDKEALCFSFFDEPAGSAMLDFLK